jgi:hypothetical protein
VNLFQLGRREQTGFASIPIIRDEQKGARRDSAVLSSDVVMGSRCSTKPKKVEVELPVLAEGWGVWGTSWPDATTYLDTPPEITMPGTSWSTARSTQRLRLGCSACEIRPTQDHPRAEHSTRARTPAIKGAPALSIERSLNRSGNRLYLSETFIVCGSRSISRQMVASRPH